MKRVFTIFLVVLTLSCQDKVKYKQRRIDPLTRNLQSQDSILRLIDSVSLKSDSIYQSIINGTDFQQPCASSIINYDKIISDFKLFKEKYKKNFESSDFPNKLPLDSVQKKSIIGFGNKIHPIYKTVKTHLGIDILAKTGVDVHSTISGKVTLIEKSLRGFGNQVIIENDIIKLVFAHLDSIIISKGESIKQGQIIGSVGNSGLSIYPHLHYEIRIQNIPINPIFTLFDQFSKEDLEYIFAKNCMSLD